MEYSAVYVWGSNHYGQLGLGPDSQENKHVSPINCSFGVLVKEIACGDEHAGFIASNGLIYTMGNNSWGQLGIGTKAKHFFQSPCLVESLSNKTTIKVSFGGKHSAALTDDGELYTWGFGKFGQLGLGDRQNRYFPNQVHLTGAAVYISCGYQHTAIIVFEEDSKSKRLFMCGANESGQLGTGSTHNEALPVPIAFYEDIKNVSAGYSHTGILTQNSSVYMMGSNCFGQLGTGNKKNSFQPIKIENFVGINKISCGKFSAALSERNELYIWGSGVFGEFLLPEKIDFNAEIVDFDISGCYGVCRDNKNKVWSWGDNNHGELGVGDYKSRSNLTQILGIQGGKIKHIKCGGSFVIAIGSDRSNFEPIDVSFDNRSITPIVYRSQSATPLDSDRCFSLPLRSSRNSLSYDYRISIPSPPNEYDNYQKRYELLKQDFFIEQEMRKNAEREVERLRDIEITNKELLKELEQRNTIVKNVENTSINEREKRFFFEKEMKGQIKYEEELKDQIRILERKIQEMAEDYEEIKIEYIKNKKNEENYLAQIGEMKERDEKMISDIDDLEREKTKFLQEIASYRDSNQNLQKQLREATRKLDELIPSITSYQSKLSSLQQENDELNAFIKENRHLTKKYSLNQSSVSPKPYYNSISTPGSPRNAMSTFPSTFPQASPLSKSNSNVRNSLEDIKSKLKSIHSNKNLIETRMQAFEEKLKNL